MNIKKYYEDGGKLGSSSNEYWNHGQELKYWRQFKVKQIHKNFTEPISKKLRYLTNDDIKEILK